MEQQHSAHTGGKDPGQGQAQGQEREQPKNHGHKRRTRGGKPTAAAAAAPQAAGSTAPPATPAQTPEAVGGPAPREPRRRTGPGAVRQEAAALYQAQLRFPLIPAPFTDALSWLPRARLTALGDGVLGVLLMLLTGAADRWLLDSSATVYGTAFLVVSVTCAAWVRPTDLFTAPVSVPLAFTAGLFFISGGTGSQALTERLTNLFPALAVNAVWLYSGTFLAVLVVTIRKIALMVQRSRVRAVMEAEDAEDEAAAEADRF